MRPICHDLYCGLGGWAEGFLSEGYECIGYDIEKHDYGTGTYPGELVLCDVRSLHGSQLKYAAVIVASPPCQEPSYRAMPWKRAKALNVIGPPHLFVELFNACFRIQREASEAAGHRIPLIVENVKGAQPWVGKAPAHFGSYYLWGDVGQVGNRVVAGRLGDYAGIAPVKAHKVPGFRFDGNSGSFQTAAVKKSGENWSRYNETGEVSPHWRMAGLKANTHDQSIKNNGGSWFKVANNTTSGKGRNPDGRLAGVKGFTPNGEPLGKNTLGRKHGSKSKARKAASAEIAKIPFPLAQHIARCFKPRTVEMEVVAR